jgi:hypothetical protein
MAGWRSRASPEKSVPKLELGNEFKSAAWAREGINGSEKEVAFRLTLPLSPIGGEGIKKKFL